MSESFHELKSQFKMQSRNWSFELAQCSDDSHSDSAYTLVLKCYDKHCALLQRTILSLSHLSFSFYKIWF